MKGIFSLLLILAVLSLLAGCAVPLVTAARKGDNQQVKTLLDSGADINEREGVATPLTWAIRHGNTDTAKLLIEKGADVNKPSGVIWRNDTPLVVAAIKGNFKIVDLLLEKGADLEYAFNICEEQSKGFGGSFYKSCLATLKSVKAKRQPAKPDISEEKLASMIQTAVEKTSKDQKKETKATSTISGIDKPSFSPSERIMRDDDLAVIIGIEGYQGLPKSDYSYDDAKLVGDYAKALGFKPRNIELLLDERATKSAIEKIIKTWLPNKAKPESRVFVYYSGHGAPEPKTGDAYIVPFDGDPNYLSDTGYPLKSLYDTLAKLQVAEVVIVLDACFSGAGGRSVLAKGARPLVMMAEGFVLPQNIAVLSATLGTQISTSSPEKGHGIFTYYFLKALKDGKKTIAEIYDYIKPLVEDEAKAINVQQSPSISPDVEKLKGRFGLRK